MIFDRKLCPDCGGSLGKNAIKCRCGWGAVSAQVNPGEISEAAKQAERERVGRIYAKSKEFMLTKGCSTGTQYLAYCRKLLNSPDFMRPSSVDHWKRVLANPKASLISHEYAKEALGKLVHAAPQRQPGEDDE